MSFATTCSSLRTCKILVSTLLVSAILLGINAAAATSSATAQEEQSQQSTNRSLLASQIEPDLDEYFVWNGFVSSNVDGLPSPEDDEQSAVILPLRGDNGLYSGTLTFQSNSPVDVVVWNRVPGANDTAIAEDFGDTSEFGVIQNETVIPVVTTSATSGSVPFIGNALELVGDVEEPFAASYALNAIAAEVETVSDLSSLSNFTAVEDEEEEEEEEE
jgi:type II secretory pathway pseudopilin PulG